MKNKILAKELLTRQGLSDKVAESIKAEFIKSATEQDFRKIVVIKAQEFIQQIEFSIGEADSLGLLDDHIKALTKLDDKDGTATNKYLAEELFPDLFNMPEKVKVENERRLEVERVEAERLEAEEDERAEIEYEEKEMLSNKQALKTEFEHLNNYENKTSE